MKNLKQFTAAAIFLLAFVVSSQNTKYWQQHVNYEMAIDMDVNTYQYKGKQTLEYTNNSPDVLTRVYYHLYFNAFQPGSEMDVRLQNIKDPDGRMTVNKGTKENPIIESRISTLKPNEIGYIKVNSLKQNGKKLNYETVGTILEVDLATPIKPGEKATFNMNFEAQVPVQIRRSGRNNREGVALSMSQWYPKLAEYDFEGWHADPYIGREFHGVWGDFDLKLTIDKSYVVGGTGYLQGEPKVKGNKKTLHFVAPNVHDFTWAADPDYIHDQLQVPNGPMLNFYYKKDLEENYLKNWKDLQPKTVELMNYFSEHIGTYPYKQYSVIQGGDGGMEYAMSTLITGKRKFESLFGVTAHELAHNWFQFLLATNEAKHEWMDEGFTTYISTLAENEISGRNSKTPFANTYNSYIRLATSGVEEPQTTHADRYDLNFAYGVAAYNKGALFLAQLGYIIGEENLKNTLKSYFSKFAFKHPTPNDILHTAELVSGLELDWYLMDWTQTTKTIDYAVSAIEDKDGKTAITLSRIGKMPMPVEVEVVYTDGSKQLHYIPLQMMRGEKPVATSTIVENDWAWAIPTYTFEVNKAKTSIASVTIDPNNQTADIDKSNNTL